jgi:hypothetical protein
MSAFAAARKAGIPHISCASARTDGRRAISPAHRAPRHQDACISPATCRSNTAGDLQPGDFFAFPSLYEGFGLPVVEAMACGIPVLTSNTSSLGEIAGDAAETIDPTDTDAIADAIVRLATDRICGAIEPSAAAARAQLLVGADARDMLAVYPPRCRRDVEVAVADARRHARSARAGESMSRSRLS